MRLFLSIFIFIFSLEAKVYNDLLGRSVEVGSAERVVFIGPGAMRMGTYMGIVPIAIESIEQRADNPPPYRVYLQKNLSKKLPSIGSGGAGVMPNIESLIALKPDVIFSSFYSPKQIEQISKKSKIPIIALSYGSSYGGVSDDYLGDIKKSLLLIGDITAKSDRAKSVVSEIESIERDIKKLKLPDKKLYIGGIAFKGARGITSTESQYPPFELLGVASTLELAKKGHNELSFEQFLSLDSDCIFIDEQSRDIVADEYRAKRAIFDNLRAYRDGCVYEVLAYNNYNTNIENLLIIPYQIASHLGVDADLKTHKNRVYRALYPKKL